MNGDRVGADAQRVADFLVGLAHGEQSEDFKLATRQTDRLAFQSQPVAPPEFRNGGAQWLHSELPGKIVAFLEQQCGLLLVVAAANVQKRL